MLAPCSFFLQWDIFTTHHRLVVAVRDTLRAAGMKAADLYAGHRFKTGAATTAA